MTPLQILYREDRKAGLSKAQARELLRWPLSKTVTNSLELIMNERLKKMGYHLTTGGS